MAGPDVPTTDFTDIIHKDGYAAISPKRPELSQAGRTVLITGGGTNIGKAISRNFGLAAASTVIIVGRRQDVLTAAVAELQRAADDAGSPTRYRAEVLDVTAAVQVDAFWDGLASEGITVDVLILNSAKFAEPKPLLELGTQEVWSVFEANVKGPFHMTERLYKQPGDGPRFVQYLSSNAVNLSEHPIVSQRPGYSLTKLSATYTFSLIADSVDPNRLQVISFHPGLIYTDAWSPLGITKDMLPFDEENLPGQFSVWATSKEASFLHGRYVYASWDVTELAREGTKKSLAADHNYLRPGIVGLKKGGNRV